MSGKMRRTQSSPAILSGVTATDATEVDSNMFRNAMLEHHLVKTGRATNEKSGPDLAKREEYATRIMNGMQSATVDSQTRAGRTSNFAHPVSAHGVGTDQIPRLLTGRRADEVTAEATAGTTPTTQHTLTGNATMPNRTIPSYTNTGTDLSDTSSAFTSNTGLMFAVEDALSNAWARDTMINAGQLEDSDRIAYTSQVKRDGFMPEGVGTGYNIPKDAGAPRIKQNRPLNNHASAHGMSPSDVMDARFSAIERTPNLETAKVILNRAEGGGFDVQTAYPVTEAASWESTTEASEETRRQRIRDERQQRRDQQARDDGRFKFGNLFD